MSALEQQLAGAEDADRAVLAAWHTDGGRDRRPEPSAPALSERLEVRRADAAALDDAVGVALAERVTFVEKHRDRLAKDAHALVGRLRGRYLELIGELERTRDELVDARSTELWARLFPAEEAVHNPPPHLARGLAGPAREATGYPVLLLAGAVWRLLRRDADEIPQALHEAQAAALGLRSDTGTTTWAGTPEAVEQERAEKKAARERNEREWAAARMRLAPGACAFHLVGPSRCSSRGRVRRRRHRLEAAARALSGEGARCSIRGRCGSVSWRHFFAEGDRQTICHEICEGSLASA